MTKKHFIALADAIREHNKSHLNPFKFDQLQQLGRFCYSQNPRFNQSRWIDYIDGKCGPNGGTIKTPKKDMAVAG
jgi:hypothetical protein